mmetsp:Transcript_32926/g.52520  ORF Transcript_32926/g.52520 Transcript_32926/m.52520 type:complete len:173 (+) Transcript_32926:367-885(+)
MLSFNTELIEVTVIDALAFAVVLMFVMVVVKDLLVVMFVVRLVFAVEVVNPVVVVVVLVLVVVLAFDDVLLVKVLPDRFVVELVFVAKGRVARRPVAFVVVLVLPGKLLELKNAVIFVVPVAFTNVAEGGIEVADVFEMVLVFVVEAKDDHPVLAFIELLVLAYVVAVVPTP